MRIAFLSWRDSTHPDGGGSEVFVEEIAAELVRRGHQVTLRCAAHGDAPAEETRHGVRLTRRGGRLTVYPRALAWLLLGNGRHCDVVVDVVNGLPFGAPLARRRGVVALVHHVHRDQWRMIYPGFRGAVGWFVESRLTPWLYRRVPFVTVSEASRADLAGLGIHDVTVVRNGTPEAPAGRLPRAPTPRLCVLARLVPHKQIEHAIDVVAALRVEGVDVNLDLIGDGWWRDQLEAHVARTDATSYVTFHGHVDADRRSDLLGQAWLMLLPSVKEGWGIAVLEAAAQGTPTVAYAAAGGVRESVLDGQTGRLVDGPSGLLTAVRDLLDDRDELARLGTAARAHSERFTWVASAEAFDAACRASVGKGPAH
jgi:glycosyltransferase involved in cell wall biosynthesis